jgi:NADPH:quinone reductase-like Zn-dependent oxidoreductase
LLIGVGNIFNPEDGTFASLITMKGDITMHIPRNFSFEEAATLPGGIATIGLSMYRDLGLDLPLKKASKQGETLLIYGGSSATGTLAIQFAKL